MNDTGGGNEYTGSNVIQLGVKALIWGIKKDSRIDLSQVRKKIESNRKKNLVLKNSNQWERQVNESRESNSIKERWLGNKLILDPKREVGIRR